jgi:hypothetical protein
MNLIMFGSSDGHRKTLDSIRVNHRVIRMERLGNQIDRIDYEWDGYIMFVSCIYCFILLTRSMSTLVYFDACCLYQLLCDSIRPDSNICNPCILSVCPLCHGLVGGYISLRQTSQ